MKRFLIAAAAAAIAVASCSPAYAKGFSSRSFSSSSFGKSSSYSSSRSGSYWGTPARKPTYSAPARPAPRVQNNVIVQKRTTVIQQNSPSGGGFLSSFAGSFAGAGIASWLFAPKPAPAAPAPQVIDCAKQPLPVDWAPHCTKQ